MPGAYTLNNLNQIPLLLRLLIIQKYFIDISISKRAKLQRAMLLNELQKN